MSARGQSFALPTSTPDASDDETGSSGSEVNDSGGAASSRLIQTFLREGVFYYILISIANLVSSIVTLLLKTGLISAPDQRDILPPVS